MKTRGGRRGGLAGGHEVMNVNELDLGLGMPNFSAAGVIYSPVERLERLLVGKSRPRETRPIPAAQ